MRSFFSMRRGEWGMLVFLLLFSAVTFLPIWRRIEVGGMLVFGWMLAALMVLSPTVALIVFLRGRTRD